MNLTGDGDDEAKAEGPRRMNSDDLCLGERPSMLPVMALAGGLQSTGMGWRPSNICEGIEAMIAGLIRRLASERTNRQDDLTKKIMNNRQETNEALVPTLWRPRHGATLWVRAAQF